MTDTSTGRGPVSPEEVPQRLVSHTELLRRSGDDPYVRYAVEHDLHAPAYALGDCVALVRLAGRDRLPRLALLGTPAAADRLLRAMATAGMLSAVSVHGITVPQPGPRSLPDPAALGLPVLGRPGEWDWMWTTVAPAEQPGEQRVVPLPPGRLDLIEDLLTRANPHTHARPRETDADWVVVADPADPSRLIGCAGAERNVAGYAMLSGITVDPAVRRGGLGTAMTAVLTRRAVLADGACTLGMFSDNDAARSVYTAMGYRTGHAWASYDLTRP